MAAPLWLMTALTVTGCSASSSAGTYDYVPGYLQALRNYPGSSEFPRAALDRFRSLYADMTAPDFPQQLAGAYAARFYFNDTLKTVTTRPALVRYMKENAERVKTSAVHVEDIASHGPDVYVRWVMVMTFPRDSGKHRSESIGITHLRFDSEGKIILHQDYWDSTQGLYNHVPVLGALIRYVHGRL